jgi:hypothetical protein
MADHLQALNQGVGEGSSHSIGIRCAEMINGGEGGPPGQS